MTRTSSILITLLLFVTGSSCAQTGTIKGRVIELEDYSLDKMGSINISMLHSRHGVTVNHPGDMSYVIRELPPGPDTVRVYTVGYDFQYVPVTVYPDSELVVNVEVTGGNGWTELDCSSRPSPPITRPGRGTITGTVTDVSTGKALSEAFIDVREDVLDTSGNGRSCSLFASETDSAGRYVVHDVAPGCYTLYGGSEIHKITVKPDRETITKFQISRSEKHDTTSSSRSKTVIGRLWSNKRRAPLSGASVAVFEPGGQTVTSDSDGVYVLRDVPPGKHILRISASGHYVRWVVVTIAGRMSYWMDEVIVREVHKPAR